MTGPDKEWDLDTALEIALHPTVDSRTWADAVEWLLLYGPEEIRAELQGWANFATARTFPELRPVGMTEQGEPVYSVADLARCLGRDEDEVRAQLADKEARHGILGLFAGQGIDVKHVQ